MTDENKPLKIEFAPGAFDNFDGTQEELDAMIAEIHRMAESGELVEQGHELTEEEWNELPDEVKLQLAQSYGVFDELGDEDELDIIDPVVPTPRTLH